MSSTNSSMHNPQSVRNHSVSSEGNDEEVDPIDIIDI